ncbi:hypothetical protein PYS58_13835 [Chryseobacterium indologenes]|uniref:hypothetical protein n=1 Tax=Chryseobacterium indologenes TaxID=253 RepID=UPI0023E830C6|nr:hypothetical protein [Chryseobacterium indologenes]WET47659.1 hypothetical protein PYS58_13835 [Chryseobacterium indologenes]
MKKNLALRLSLLFALALSLQSCRTGEDYLSAKEEQYYSNKFQVFTSFNDEPVDYAKGFKTLMENYDEIHKTHYTRTSAIKSGNLGKSDEEYVEFRLHSQSMLLEDDERWIIYPMIKNGQVSGLMAGILRNEETEVEFRKLESGNVYYDEVLTIFSMAYIKNKLKSGLNSKGGCGFDSNDACDIGNIDISPPKGGGPKGGGPKSGCTGLNNCINPNLGGGESGGGPGGTGSSYVEPCDKTKNLLNNAKTKPAIDALKTKSTQGGENGYKIKADGTPSSEIPGGDHSVNFGDKTGYAGGYHNHTPTGIPMLSPPDIDQLLQFALAQGNYGNPTNAFIGMVAPNGMHYIVWFNGGYNDALLTFSQQELDAFTKKFETRNYLFNSSSSAEGLEKLLFKTLSDMKISDKVIIQRIEPNGTAKTINKNIDGTISAVPC